MTDAERTSLERERPTIIVVHPKERLSKCTVRSLRGREGFVFWKYPRCGAELTADYVRLGFGGPVIGPDDRSRGLLVLDGTWKLAAAMERDYTHVPVRSLPELKTAYPRISKVSEDPQGGLATIEALYAAFFLTGRETDGLLDDYHWAEEFLTANEDVFRDAASEVMR